MLLEIHDRLGSPLVVHATRVLICLPDGTPVAFSVQMSPTHIRHFRAGDPDFVTQLRHHGIDRAVVVQTLDNKTLGVVRTDG